MGIDIQKCSICGKHVPFKLMSEIDPDICSNCASKLVLKAQRDDGSWYEQGLQIGIMPWEQFPNEPRSAYMVFCVYRDAYPNELSIKEIVEQSGYGTNTIRHWRKRWRWQDRYFKWASKCDNDKLIQQAKIKKEMNNRQIEAAQDIFAKALTRVSHIDPDEMTPKEALAWAEMAAKMERTAIEDNDKILDKELEHRNTKGTVEHKKLSNQNDDKLSEVLGILANSGALNISTNTTISTPKVIEGEVVDIMEQND